MKNSVIDCIVSNLNSKIWLSICYLYNFIYSSVFGFDIILKGCIVFFLIVIYS